MYMAIADLEMAFDRVPQKVIWLAMRKFVTVGDGLNDEYQGKVGVHQGSVLSSQLFIVVRDAFYKWMEDSSCLPLQGNG